MKLRRYRPVAIVLLVLHLGACTTWRPSPVGPRQLIEEERASPIRFTRPDGTSVVVRNPRIRNDSIAVVSGVCRRLPGISGPRRYRCPTTALLALDDVRVLEVQRPARGRTLLLISPLLVTLVFAAAWSAACSSGDNILCTP